MSSIERQIDDHLTEEAANEVYAERCQAWADEQMATLLAQAKTYFCIDVPTYIYRDNKATTISTCVDEILTDSDSERYYQCMSHLMGDDESVREKYGREAIFTHLEECLERQLEAVAPFFVKRNDA